MYTMLINKNSSIKNIIKSFLDAIIINDNFKKFISNNKLNQLIDLKIRYFTLYNKKSGIPLIKSYCKIKYDFIKKINEEYCFAKFSAYSLLDINNQGFDSITTSTYICLLKKISNHWFIEYISDIESLEYSIDYKNLDDFVHIYNSLLDKEISKYNSLLLNFNTLNINFNNTLQTTSILKKTLYKKTKAVEYAEKYALTYNKEYENFNENGGDCTNFVSQVINYAGIPTSSTWKPYSNSWIRVKELRDYLIYNNLAYEIATLNHNCIGCIIQFFSPIKNTWAHSAIITYKVGNTFLYCCHSYDKLIYPLSYVYPSVYPKIRIIIPY